MGKIQGAINGALGTAAASMVAIGHAKSTSEQKAQSAENTAVVAEGQATNAANESEAERVSWTNDKVDSGEVDAAGNPIMKTKSQMHAEAATAVDAAQQEVANQEALEMLHIGDPVKSLEARNALKEAKKAFETLDIEYQAIRSRQDRANQMGAHARELRTKADEARLKHEKLWGGKR